MYSLDSPKYNEDFSFKAETMLKDKLRKNYVYHNEFHLDYMYDKNKNKISPDFRDIGRKIFILPY